MITKMSLQELIYSVNYHYTYLRQNGEIADITEILDDMRQTITKNGFTREQVYAEWVKQFS